MLAGSPVGRLAPSPTGAQHLGNARTYLLAWLSIRARGGQLVLRIEDLDSPRTKRWAIQQAIEDLAWLGLDWDQGPRPDEIIDHRGMFFQSQRIDRYAQVFEQLKAKDKVYPCTCTRSQIENSASAPHESELDGIVYPGTCAHRGVEDAFDLLQKKTAFAWRFRVPGGVQTWKDEFAGIQTLNPQVVLGDFIIARMAAEGLPWLPAYQMAVVIDDHDMGITEVVRGNDLIPSTFRQMCIYEALQWESPQMVHVPLVVGADGRRLAKRHGDTRLSTYRQQGIEPERIIGYLAHASGLTPDDQPIQAHMLLPNFNFSKLKREKLEIRVDPFLT